MPLAQVADGIEGTTEESMIRRYGRERTIAVRAEPRDGENTNVAFERIRPLLEDIELPIGYSLEWGGDHEQSSDAQQALASTLAVPYLAMVTGQPCGFMALLGLRSLTGMLIKNAVVLVD